MQTRPWPLIILAFFHFVTPLVSTVINCYFLKVGPIELLAIIWSQGLREIIEFGILPIVAGVAIYKTKKWSYPVFIACILWISISNYFAWKQSSQVFPLWLLVALYVLDIGLVSYFLLPQVRITYFDSRVRWWENHPRYWMQACAKLQLMERIAEAEIDNISVGGAYILTKDSFEIGDCIRIQFKVLANEYDVNGEVVHKGRGSGGYGVRFVHTPETLETMERLTCAMEVLKVPRRPDYTGFFQGFMEWFKRLLTTGHGIVPEVPEAFIHKPKQQ